MTRHKHGISALVSQTSFYGETNVGSGNVDCLLRQDKKQKQTNKQTNKENKKHQSEEKINDQI